MKIPIKSEQEQLAKKEEELNQLYRNDADIRLQYDTLGVIIALYVVPRLEKLCKQVDDPKLNSLLDAIKQCRPQNKEDEIADKLLATGKTKNRNLL